MRTLVVMALSVCLFACKSDDKKSGGGSGTASAAPGSGSASGTAAGSGSGTGAGTASGSAAAPPTADVATAVTAGMEMLADIAKALEAQADCPAKGKALTDWSAANQDRMKTVGEGLRKFDSAALGPEVKAQMEKNDVVKKLFTDAAACMKDPAFEDAWEKTSAVFEPPAPAPAP